ncbi:ATP-binding protein [Alteromonas sp. a30]|uniref:ATP-binding protein n=1 Tax=Alteromonas sp. a30 TaxID=2730917 RepID=UPI002280B7D6|nr:ATP-binding protein [Alteromonas sp. a30]MCY7295008.1 helix-turn-helix domain-containing protein [Alteromonas sp. a30]
MTLFTLVGLTTTVIVFLIFDFATQLDMSQAALNQAFHIACTLVLLVTLAFVPRKSEMLPIRFFWFCINVALACWLFTKIGLLIAHQLDVAENIYLFADYGYFAYFLVMVFSLLLYNSAHHQDNKQLSLRASIRQYGALVFMGMMFVYLVIIPSQSQSHEFTQHFSSFLFFMLMDAYLVLAFYSQSKASERQDWNRRFLFLSFSFVCFFILDFLELMSRSQVLPPQGQHWVSLLWFSPYFFLAYALKQAPSLTKLKPQNPPSWLPQPELMMLPLLPLIHFAGYFAGAFEEELREIREIILVMWITFYCLIIYLLDKQQGSFSSPRNHNENDKHAPSSQAPKLEVANSRSSQISLNGVPFACLILDNKGKIEAANDAVTPLTGYQSSELTGVFFNALLSNDEPLESIFRFAEGTFSESKLVTSHTREVRLQHRSGRILYCYIRFAEVLENQYSVCLIDITKLHEAEAQALSIKDKFLANITHEFRTPLTLIQGAIEEGEDKIQESALKHRFAVAKSNVYHILKMVEQLLNLSKITSAPKLVKTVQPASEIIKQCCLQFLHLCQQKRIDFQYQLIEKCWVEAHEDSLQQILFNLLSNAYKYTPEGGEIRLVTTLSTDKIQIEITDTGCGMTQEEQTRLFERFQRADISKHSSTFGMGIGLALISELVQLHQWRIQVQSEVHQGSCFTLTLPVTAEPDNAEVKVKAVSFDASHHATSRQAAENKPKAELTNTSVITQDNRLLIVEDNLDMQDYLRHLLSEHYQLEVIGTGEAGCHYAEEAIPDLIICDLMLPDISGYQVVERIKQNPHTQHIPILMLTAKSDIESKLAGLENRADDYLTKPFHYKELQLRLQNLLSIREKIQILLRQQLNQNVLAKAKTDALPDALPQSDVNPHQDFLSKLQTVAHQHYSDCEFGLSLLASGMAMSERQLQRRLKASLGMTPGEYIREYRLIQSRSLLHQGFNVGQVSDAVGFSDPAYFARCFKQWLGCTPSDYQKQAHQDGSP